MIITLDNGKETEVSDNIHGRDFLNLDINIRRSIVQDRVWDIFHFGKMFEYIFRDIDSIDKGLAKFNNSYTDKQLTIEEVDKDKDLEGFKKIVLLHEFTSLITYSISSAIHNRNDELESVGWSKSQYLKRKKDKLEKFYDYYNEEFMFIVDPPKSVDDLDNFFSVAEFARKHEGFIRSIVSNISILDNLIKDRKTLKAKGRNSDWILDSLCEEIIITWYKYTGIKPTKSRNNTVFNSFVDMYFNLYEGINHSRDRYNLISDKINLFLGEGIDNYFATHEEYPVNIKNCEVLLEFPVE